MDNRTIATLLASSVVGAATFSGATYAQQAAQAGAGDTLQEVVVTATRQADTVHNVPLTVTAVTSTQIEEQGIKVAADLTTAVTSLRISSPNAGGGTGFSGSNSNGASVSIRGISSSISGAAPTTGIYIDDVPLQQRQPIAATGGGAAFPLLFDLQRVEVLKGPQGTLYGGSSEGGTLRFITQQPSLTASSLNVSAENSYTEYGDPSYEIGLAGGTPLDDSVAVHAAAYWRNDGGYVDHVSQFSGNVVPSGKDTNSSTHLALHTNALFQFTQDASATIGVVYQEEKYKDTDNFWGNIPQYQASSGGGTLYTYGPYNMFGPFKSGTNTNVGQNFFVSDLASNILPVAQPHSQTMVLPSLTLDYATGPVDVKSVTAFNHTKDFAFVNTSFLDLQGQGGNPPEGGHNALPGNSIFVANLPLYNSTITYQSVTDSVTEELRLSSSDSDARFRWVAGGFLQHMTQTTATALNSNFGDFVAALARNVSVNPPGPVTTALSGGSVFTENQYAVFGEGTFKITEPLRLVVGVRYTKDDFNYFQTQGGALFGGPVVPNANGKVSGNAVTPKIGLQYVQNDDVNYYVTATKGYRPGGINPLVQPTCATAFAQDHLSTAPFDKDSLWSYEAGSKIRAWDKRLSVNASVYYIDWKNVQTAVNPGCGQTFTINGAGQTSKGVDFEGSLLVTTGLTATLRSAYTNAQFKGTVGVAGIPAFVQDGNSVPYTPQWQHDLTLEYRFTLANGNSAYVRADGTYESSVKLNLGPGTLDYSPNNYWLPNAKEFGLRAGFAFKKTELSLFARNLTNSQDLLYRGGFAHGPGPNGCTNASCSTYKWYGYGNLESTYRPRTIGISLAYHD